MKRLGFWKLKIKPSPRLCMNNASIMLKGLSLSSSLISQSLALGISLLKSLKAMYCIDIEVKELERYELNRTFRAPKSPRTRKQPINIPWLLTCSLFFYVTIPMRETFNRSLKEWLIVNFTFGGKGKCAPARPT